MKKWIFAIFCIFLIGCSQMGSQAESLETTKSTEKKPIIKGRINTIECKDADDWYLDGFRVGKSFRSQKTEMYQKRVAYCKNELTHADQFQAIWQDGFNIGIKK